MRFLRDAIESPVAIEQKLFKIASSVLKFTRTYPDLVRLTFLRITMPPRDLIKIAAHDARYRKGFELLQSVMEEGIQSGALTDAFNPYDLTIAFTGPLYAVLIRHLRGDPGPPPKDRLAQRIVALFMQGAAARKKRTTS